MSMQGPGFNSISPNEKLSRILDRIRRSVVHNMDIDQAKKFNHQIQPLFDAIDGASTAEAELFINGGEDSSNDV